MEAGTPGDIPYGNCTDKCLTWPRRCNEEPSCEPLVVLGRVLQEFMEQEFDSDHPNSKLQERIHGVLARNGLRYELNGQVFQARSGLSSRTLAEMLRAGDVESEFDQALSSVNIDPAASITVASSLLEALFKAYIEDQGLQLPGTQDISNLCRIVRDNFGLDSGSLTNKDLRRILSPIISIITGVGSLRTHAGSAQGPLAKDRPVNPSEAWLTNAAHVAAIFVIELWQNKIR